MIDLPTGHEIIEGLKISGCDRGLTQPLSPLLLCISSGKYYGINPANVDICGAIFAKVGAQLS